MDGAAERSPNNVQQPHMVGVGRPPHKVIASLLGHQVTTGKVRRTGRATYELVPWRMSRATKWRYEHWWR